MVMDGVCALGIRAAAKRLSPAQQQRMSTERDEGRCRSAVCVPLTTGPSYIEYEDEKPPRRNTANTGKTGEAGINSNARRSNVSAARTTGPELFGGERALLVEVIERQHLAHCSQVPRLHAALTPPHSQLPQTRGPARVLALAASNHGHIQDLHKQDNNEPRKFSNSMQTTHDVQKKDNLPWLRRWMEALWPCRPIGYLRGQP